MHWPPQVATPRSTGQGELIGIFYPIFRENLKNCLIFFINTLLFSIVNAEIAIGRPSVELLLVKYFVEN